MASNISARWNASGDAEFVDIATGEVIFTLQRNGPFFKTVDDKQTGPGSIVTQRISVGDVATSDIDVVLQKKTRVIDVLVVKTGANGGGANSVQIKNGANAISNAISTNINDTTIARATSIDDAQHEIAAGGTLRCAVVKAAGNSACEVYVLGILVD